MSAPVARRSALAGVAASAIGLAGARARPAAKACPVEALAAVAACRCAASEIPWSGMGYFEWSRQMNLLADAEDAAAAIRATSLPGALFQIFVALADAKCLAEDPSAAADADAEFPDRIVRCLTSAAEVLMAHGVPHDAGLVDHYVSPWVDPFAEIQAES